MYRSRSRDDDCTVPWDELDDPDVTGILVVVAFNVTAVVTVCLIVYVWASGKLPYAEYNGVDRMFMNRSAKERTLIPLKDGVDPMAPAANDELSIIESLVIALSDQHLVTGAALIVSVWIILSGAGGVNQVRSVYSIRIAIALAAACTGIHLSSLIVLRKYLEERLTLRMIRVTLMILLALVLASLLVVSVLNPFWEVNYTVACAWNELGINLPGVSVLEWVTPVFLVLTLATSFNTRLKRVFGKPEPISHQSLATMIRLRYRRSPTKADLEKLAERMSMENYQEAVAFCELAGTGPSLRKTVKMWLKLTRYALDAIDMSFLGQVLDSFFFFTFGMTMLWSIYVMRNGSPYFEPNFGQLMPLLLLSQPVFAVLETQTEIRRLKKARDMSNNTPEPSPRSSTSSRPTNTTSSNIELQAGLIQQGIAIGEQPPSSTNSTTALVAEEIDDSLIIHPLRRMTSLIEAGRNYSIVATINRPVWERDLRFINPVTRRRTTRMKIGLNYFQTRQGVQQLEHVKLGMNLFDFAQSLYPNRMRVIVCFWVFVQFGISQLNAYYAASAFDSLVLTIFMIVTTVISFLWNIQGLVAQYVAVGGL